MNMNSMNSSIIIIHVYISCLSTELPSPHPSQSDGNFVLLSNPATVVKNISLTILENSLRFLAAMADASPSIFNNALSPYNFPRISDVNTYYKYPLIVNASSFQSIVPIY